MRLLQPVLLTVTLTSCGLAPVSLPGERDWLTHRVLVEGATVELMLPVSGRADTYFPRLPLETNLLDAAALIPWNFHQSWEFPDGPFKEVSKTLDVRIGVDSMSFLGNGQVSLNGVTDLQRNYVREIGALSPGLGAFFIDYNISGKRYFHPLCNGLYFRMYTTSTSLWDHDFREQLWKVERRIRNSVRVTRECATPSPVPNPWSLRDEASPLESTQKEPRNSQVGTHNGD